MENQSSTQTRFACALGAYGASALLFATAVAVWAMLAALALDYLYFKGLNDRVFEMVILGAAMFGAGYGIRRVQDKRTARP